MLITTKTSTINNNNSSKSNNTKTTHMGLQIDGHENMDRQNNSVA